jgi:hypothetical protein
MGSCSWASEALLHFVHSNETNNEGRNEQIMQFNNIDNIKIEHHYSDNNYLANLNLIHYLSNRYNNPVIVTYTKPTNMSSSSAMMSSNPSSLAPRSWLKSLTLTILTSATGYLLYYYYYKCRVQSSKSSAAEEEKDSTRIDGNERELVELLLESMDNLQNTGLITGQLEESLYVWLLGLDASICSLGLRLLSCQWLLLYLTMEAMNCHNKYEYDNYEQRIIEKDLKLGLKLLSNLPTTNKAAQLLKLELIQRSRDYTELANILQNYLSHHVSNGGLSYEEVVLLFTSLPLIGRWEEFLELGSRIIQVQSNLNAFHAAAQTRKDIIDYEIIYSLLHSNLHYFTEKFPTQPPDQLHFAQYLITAFKLKFNCVQINDRSNEGEEENNSNINTESIKRTFDPTGNSGWRDYSVNSLDIIRVNGAIAQMISKSSFPISMVGPVHNNCTDRKTMRQKMLLRGYVDIDCNSTNLPAAVSLSPISPNSSSPVILRQIEEYYLEREDLNNNHWVGHYILIQQRLSSRATNSTKPHKVTVKFDLHAKLELLTPLIA